MSRLLVPFVTYLKHDRGGRKVSFDFLRSMFPPLLQAAVGPPVGRMPLFFVQFPDRFAYCYKFHAQIGLLAVWCGSGGH